MAKQGSKSLVLNYKSKLEPLRHSFCHYLAADPLMDATAAYQRLKPEVDPRTAANMGRKLLKEPDVQKYLETLLLDRQKRLEIDEDWVVSRLRDVHDRCMQETPVWHGERYDENGVEKEPSYFKFDAPGALKALELMGKHMRMFSDKVDASQLNVSVDIDLGGDKGAIEGKFQRVGSN